MIRFAPSAALALALAVSVAGGASSAHAAGDNRLVSRAFKADEVVRVDGKLNVQASIMFADGESIENVAVGDSESWQITPNKRANLLFVKPLTASARTNMTVVTDKRTYFFDLVASPSATPIYALRFTYPGEAPAATAMAPALVIPTAPAPAAAAPSAAPSPISAPLPTPAAASAPAPGFASLNPAEQQALGADGPADPALLNFGWVKDGARGLYPSRVFDDGTATYLTWAPGVPLPAILVRNEKNEEGPVNYAMRGDAIVIDGVPGLIVLRSGKNRASLTYKGARVAGVRATGLTALPEPGAAAQQAAASAPASSKPRSE